MDIREEMSVLSLMFFIRNHFILGQNRNLFNIQRELEIIINAFGLKKNQGIDLFNEQSELKISNK